jgi:GxxExxY protein
VANRLRIRMRETPRLISFVVQLFVLTIMSWTRVLQASIATKHTPLMKTIQQTCTSIVQRHRSGATEGFYQRMLAAELYHRGIPCLTEVEVFTMSGCVPVLVGRLDMEVDHSIILELKTAPCITSKHIQQLMKYVRARSSTGMHITEAAVVCFTDRDTVEFHCVRVQARSPFFRVEICDK